MPETSQNQSAIFQLIIGPSGDYYYFKDEIIERIQETGPFEYDFIYFLPVKRATRYFKEQLTDAVPNHVLADPPVYTFYEFMSLFYRSFPKARKVISQAMRLFLVEETLKTNVESLEFFTETSAKRKGLITKVDALINELRECGYASNELLKKIEGEDMRINDFALLIDKFDNALGDRLIDEAGAVQEAIRHLEEDGDVWRKKFSRVKTIYMSGYGLFSRPMIRFFELLRNVCSIKIKLDYVPNYPQLFSHPEEAYEKLEHLNPIVIQDQTPDDWETQLFRRKKMPEKLDLQKNVLVQPATSRSQEVAFIANYVKRLHHELKIPLHDIGITFPSLEQYAPLIHEIFPQYGLPDNGLPYNLSTGFQLSQSPLIRSFLLALEVPVLGFEVRKFLQLLSSPFFKAPEDKTVDLNAVKQLAREMRLTHFRGNWEKKLADRLDYLRSILETAIDEDELEQKRIREKIALFESTKERLAAIIETLQPLDKKQPVQDFRQRYLQILTDFGFLNWYKEQNSHLTPIEKEREYRAFNRFVKVLDQFSWIVSNLHGGQKLSLKEFQQYMSLLVSQAVYNVREWANYGLQIMPRLEVLSVQPKVLIFGGMVEGDFPRPFTQDVFFHDDERQQLGLAATEDLLAQDRYLFYQILRGKSERLVFTYPRFQKEAAMVPSNFLDVLLDQTNVRARADVPSRRFLLNQKELLEQVSRRIPAGISAVETANLQRWQKLNSQDPAHAEQLHFWIQRIRDGYSKRKRNTFNEFEGMLAQYSEIVDQLQKRFSNAPFSITRLETFAFCPIKFFFKYLVKIEEEEELESGLTPLERGELIHGALFRFYSELREKGRQAVPWEEAELLYKIADEEFNRLPFEGMLFELEREKYFGSQNRPGMWDVFLNKEKEYIEQLGFIPAYFEAAFGRTGSNREQDKLLSQDKPVTISRGDEEIKITGKIDRVDLNSSGEALLIDYKTGSKSAKVKDVARGTELQLAIYAVILPKLLAAAQAAEAAMPVMTAIYQVKDAENCKQKPIMLDRNAGLNMKMMGHAPLPNKYVTDADGQPLTFDNVLEAAQDHVFTYVQQIQNGKFRHTRYPEDPPCRDFCEFRRMCRKDTLKLLASENNDASKTA